MSGKGVLGFGPCGVKFRATRYICGAEANKPASVDPLVMIMKLRGMSHLPLIISSIGQMKMHVNLHCADSITSGHNVFFFSPGIGVRRVRLTAHDTDPWMSR